MRRCTGIVCLGLLASLAGCVDTSVDEPQVAQVPLSAEFDPARTGTIRGQVRWDGDLPRAESVVVKVIAYHPHLYKNPVTYETPHIPRVNPRNQGVADAVVFLRGIDPHRSRAWDHGEPHIEFRDRQMRMSQDSSDTGVGFVRRGAKITTINRDADFHSLRGRGAAFFSLPLITTDRPAEQILKDKGIVELFDAGGYYWLHAHLFVDEHPYYARTDADGTFVLEQVPDGTYEIVSWLPSWVVAHKDRDPETTVIARYAWAEPRTQQQTVRVRAGQAEAIEFRWSRGMFLP